MELTTHIRREASGLYVGTADEIPGLRYRGTSADEVEARLLVLKKALSSPHVKLVGVDPDGNGVILTLDRRGSDCEDDPLLFPVRRAPFSLEEAIQLLN